MDELEQRAEARIGRLLNDKWRLERLLGIGGMASVYAGRHRNGAKAALKILHPELGADADVRGRFLREGYAANKVEHPGVVQVLDDDVVTSGSAGDEGTAYLVMELLEGESLLAYTRRMGAAVPEGEVLQMMEQVLDALGAAHTQGIVHRDLKPENLFLVKSTSGSDPPPSRLVEGPSKLRVKVLDFGIARIADGAGKTRVGTALGTPTYMAPEQAQGRRNSIDGRTDLFAIGATMWRMLTGLRVHDAPSAAEILAKMASEPARPIRSVAPQISPAVAAIIDRALRFHQDDRYVDAKAMQEDVRAALDGAPLRHAVVNVSPAAVTEERTAAAAPRAGGAGGSFKPRIGEPTAGDVPTSMERPAAAPITPELPTTAKHDDLPPLAPVAAIAPLPPVTAVATVAGLPSVAASAPLADASPRLVVSTAPRARTPLYVGVAVGVLALGGLILFLVLPSSSAAKGDAPVEKSAISATVDEEAEKPKDPKEPEKPAPPATAAADDEPDEVLDQPTSEAVPAATTEGLHGATTVKKPVAPVTAKPKPTPTSTKVPQPKLPPGATVASNIGTTIGAAPVATGNGGNSIDANGNPNGNANANGNANGKDKGKGPKPK